MPTPTQLVRIAKEYLAAIERGEPFETMERYFTPDSVQKEFPNRLLPNGARRTLDDLRAASRRGAQAVEQQRCEVVGTVAQKNRVALEVRWSARLRVSFGSLQAGETMRARFALFLEFRDDRIARQHNYDCFDPF